MGNGLKNESVSYYPVFPPMIPVDPIGQDEMPEPTPLTAPVVETVPDGGAADDFNE